MPIYDGVVTVAEDDIPVLVEVDDHVVRLSASGTEIGEWRKDECEIRHIADTTYAIRAENETLSFVPNQPSLFAAAVNGGLTDGQANAPQPAEAARPVTTAATVGDAPPPKPLTMALFYALCALTAALALWALVSMTIL